MVGYYVANESLTDDTLSAHASRIANRVKDSFKDAVVWQVRPTSRVVLPVYGPCAVFQASLVIFLLDHQCTRAAQVGFTRNHGVLDCAYSCFLYPI